MNYTHAYNLVINDMIIIDVKKILNSLFKYGIGAYKKWPMNIHPFHFVQLTFANYHDLKNFLQKIYLKSKILIHNIFKFEAAKENLHLIIDHPNSF